MKPWILIWLTIIVCLLVVGAGFVTEIRKMKRHGTSTVQPIPVTIPDKGYDRPQDYQTKPLREIEEMNRRAQEQHQKIYKHPFLSPDQKGPDNRL